MTGHSGDGFPPTEPLKGLRQILLMEQGRVEAQQSKVQIFAQMIQQPIDPQLAFTTPGLFPDPQAAYEMSKPFLIAAGKLGEDGKAPKSQEQPKQDVTDTNVGNIERSDDFVDANKIGTN